MIFLCLKKEGAKRTPPEGAETVIAEELADNVYDVAEFDENEVGKHERVVPLGQSPPSHDTLLTACNGKANEAPSTSNISTYSSDHCLIENEGEKTIIFTSAAIAANSSQLKISNESKQSGGTTNSAPEHQILISSSSWIDLQGGTKHVTG